MRWRLIRSLIKLMEEHQIQEVEIRGIFGRVKLSKYTGLAHQMLPAIPPEAKKEEKKEAAEEKEKGEDRYIAIKAPLVGTFYRAPAPGAPPFVDVGDEVTSKTIVCIIEAMKVMNEIKSEHRGIVKEILVENGKPVEFGQVLFIIELIK